MNQENVNLKDEIIAITCAACHKNTIYLKIRNAAENQHHFRAQNYFCNECQIQKKTSQAEPDKL